MAAEDYYSFASRHQLDRLNATKAQLLADLQNAKAVGDGDTAGNAIEQIAAVEQAKANIVALHDQYVASQTPPAPQYQTAEELRAKPLEKMSWDDALQVARNGSKYGRDLNWNDPYVVAGYHEANRRRQRGE